MGKIHQLKTEVLLLSQYCIISWKTRSQDKHWKKKIIEIDHAHQWLSTFLSHSTLKSMEEYTNKYELFIKLINLTISLHSWRNNSWDQDTSSQHHPPSPPKEGKTHITPAPPPKGLCRGVSVALDLAERRDNAKMYVLYHSIKPAWTRFFEVIFLSSILTLTQREDSQTLANNERFCLPVYIPVLSSDLEKWDQARKEHRHSNWINPVM